MKQKLTVQEYVVVASMLFGLFFGAGNLRQHRTIASLRFGGSFPPILRSEKFEIHTVFLYFSNLDLTKNLSPNQLAELRGAALIFPVHMGQMAGSQLVTATLGFRISSTLSRQCRRRQSSCLNSAGCRLFGMPFGIVMHPIS